jgi:hypothetical protein
VTEGSDSGEERRSKKTDKWIGRVYLACLFLFTLATRHGGTLLGLTLSGITAVLRPGPLGIPGASLTGC